MPCDHTDLQDNDRATLLKKAIRLIAAIRTVLYMQGDNRCWMDIHIAYAEVPGIPPLDLGQVSLQEFANRCNFYIKHSEGLFPNIPLEETVPINDYGLHELSIDLLRSRIIDLRELLYWLYETCGSYLTSTAFKRLYDAIGDRALWDTRLPPHDLMSQNCGRFLCSKFAECREGKKPSPHEW